MHTLSLILSILIGAFFIWILSRTIRQRPELFTLEKFKQCVGPIVMLALFLAVLVLILSKSLGQPS